MSDTPQVQTFSLTPHSAGDTGHVDRLEGQVLRSGTDLRVSYALEGRLEGLQIPEQRTSGFADELWRHTCFEMFITRAGEPGYYEFNFSPSRQWAVYGFARYRERAALAHAAIPDLHITVRRTAGRLELDASVDLGLLSPSLAKARLLCGISAVIETRAGSLAYWALKHPCAKPDFHHSDAFALELHEIRN